MRRIIPAIILLLAAANFLVAAELPDYRGPINDLAGVLSRSDVRQLESKALAYREQTGSEIGVLIVPRLDGRPIEDYAYDVFKAWGIGQKEKDNGVLFLVAIQERKARVEVGYGLEAELTDLESGRLVNKSSPMAQFFRKGDYAGGVGSVLDGIVQAIGGEYNPPREKNETHDDLSPFVPFIIILVAFFISMIRRKKSTSRWFGGPFIGGFGGGGGGFTGGGGGGGFSFGGGSSGGGGASGGW